MSDYGSAAGVAYLVRHLTTSGTFDANSKVTLTAVGAFLDDVSAEMTMILAAQGYTTPITTPTRVKTYLDRIANNGGAMYCELTQPSAGFRGVENADTRAGAFRRLYEEGKKLLGNTQALLALGVGQSTATTRGIWSGSTQDDDGNDKDPVFERDMFDYPGTGLASNDADEEA